MGLEAQRVESVAQRRDGLRAYYDSAYHGIIHEGMIKDEQYYWARSEAFSRLYFTAEDRDRKVLDYGCGLGQTVASLPNAHGYDASSDARRIAREHGVKVFDELADIPASEFDVVICRHALEHVPDPLEVLTRLGTFLRPDGTLILILPKEKHYQTPFEPDAHMHIFSWNFRCINNLLSLAGMRAFKNFTLYNIGYRALLGMRRFVGARLYEGATAIAGRLVNNGELVIHAKRVA